VPTPGGPAALFERSRAATTAGSPPVASTAWVSSRSPPELKLGGMDQASTMSRRCSVEATAHRSRRPSTARAPPTCPSARTAFARASGSGSRRAASSKLSVSATSALSRAASNAARRTSASPCKRKARRRVPALAPTACRASTTRFTSRLAAGPPGSKPPSIRATAAGAAKSNVPAATSSSTGRMRFTQGSIRGNASLGPPEDESSRVSTASARSCTGAASRSPCRSASAIAAFRLVKSPRSATRAVAPVQPATARPTPTQNAAPTNRSPRPRSVRIIHAMLPCDPDDAIFSEPPKSSSQMRSRARTGPEPYFSTVRTGSAARHSRWPRSSGVAPPKR
jgi:hypothetical protein